MTKNIWLPCCLLLLAACDTENTVSQAPTNTQAPPAEILVHNAQIYTLDADFPTASAMLFDSEGKIQEVGDAQAMLDTFPDARRIDLGGRTVIPGLIDSHAHLYGLA
ncbi:MAG: hypothetical protein OQJ84_10535, partial [Xanthomonadales bacterium]|nr:hypothetical protein [Xanthomonadales bacterium]